ncbi:MAG: pilus assembly protein CpaB [Nocardioidaceae bacterium]|jgi:pilus assembly protein CpaB|nr:pilus assembly protein CpaB [Nocardioidaceae bacterium]
MNKRAIAAIAAGVLALLGVLVLVLYAQGANDRAFNGAKLVPVVRFTNDVSAGTSAADLAADTQIAKLPSASVPAGAVTNLSQVAGLSTNASVQKGEVLLKSRMAAPGGRSKGSTGVPKGYQEISIALDAEHSVAGSLKAGDRVGLIATFEPKDGTKAQFTNFSLNQVLVMKADTTFATGNKADITATMVTLAVKELPAEKIAHAQKWGAVWLTRQNADTDTSGSKIITAEDVVK